MKTSAFLAAAVALCLLPARADAQVRLQIENGLVTLEAQNVSVRQILAEWARVGGARIVNGEKVAGGPVTLQLKAIPERQALDTILRGVSGYMLASRQAGAPGMSGFDRILILPTSAAPRAASAPAPAPASSTFPSGRPMPMQAQPTVAAEPVEEIGEEEESNGLEPDADTEDEGGEQVVQPQPGMNPRAQRPPAFQNPMTVQGQPFGSPSSFPGAPQPVESESDDEPPAQVMPGNPFGAVPPGASATPGVISPVPQQDPRQPQTRRPPR
jgi:hypothetical protein